MIKDYFDKISQTYVEAIKWDGTDESFEAIARFVPTVLTDKTNPVVMHRFGDIELNKGQYVVKRSNSCMPFHIYPEQQFETYHEEVMDGRKINKSN